MPKTKALPKEEELEDDEPIKVPAGDIEEEELGNVEESEDDGMMDAEDVNPFGDRWEE